MKKEKFNSLLCYDNSKADVILQFINLNNIDNLIQLYSLLESLPGRITLNRNKDGKGFMISLKHRK